MRCEFCMEEVLPCTCSRDAQKLVPEILQLASRNGMRPVLLALQAVWRDKLQEVCLPGVPEQLLVAANRISASLQLVLINHLHFTVELGKAFEGTGEQERRIN